MSRYVSSLFLSKDLVRVACVLVPHRKVRGLYLAVSRKNEPTKPGLPGGKVGPQELWDEAARRELLEETRVRALKLRPVFIGTWERYLVHTFVAEE